MNTYTNGQITDIKLVIWDLDETFWQGTLSDNQKIVIPEKHISLIRRLTDLGIVNSICSKNNAREVENILREKNILDYFVFNSINWEPKGVRIQNTIKNMGFRNVNVLFIDDNHLNLEEAEYYCPGLALAYPDVINDIFEEIDSPNFKGIFDYEHKRLQQYKVLESKYRAKEQYQSNTDFLMESRIRVEICSDCVKDIDRIHELIMRSNQLNFTKLRSSYEETKQLIEDKNVNCGTVWVNDRYGDYGMVGFYAEKDNALIHFLFSCRTIGMGIEQYVYNILHRPKLNIVGSVIGSLDNTDIPLWINRIDNPRENDNQVVEDKELQGGAHSVLFKGPCDMLQIFNFIHAKDVIDTEFSFVNPKTGVFIESTNHLVQILESQRLSKDIKKAIINELPFSAPEFYDTNMFDDQYRIIFLSTLHDGHLGLYRNKENGGYVAYGEGRYPLTDSRYHQDYIDKKVFTANCRLTADFLRSFSEKYEFCGVTSASQFKRTIEGLLNCLPESTKLVLILGMEQPCSKCENPAYEKAHMIYTRNNAIVREIASDNERLAYIDLNEFVLSQEDMTDTLNHFTKPVYYKLAKEIVKMINDVTSNRDLSVVSETAMKRSFLLQKMRDTELGKLAIKVKHSLANIYYQKKMRYLPSLQRNQY